MHSRIIAIIFYIETQIRNKQGDEYKEKTANKPK